jgi:hypothetical protein
MCQRGFDLINEFFVKENIMAGTGSVSMPNPIISSRRYSRVEGYEIGDDAYYCHSIGKEVIISSMVEQEITANAIITKLESTLLDCDHKKECGVVTESGPDIIVDWEECGHPELKDDNGVINIE